MRHPSPQPTPCVSPPLPRRRRKDARPAELASAALDLFIDKGFAATRLDDVAAHAGVAKGTLYLYFASKEALFEAAIREHLLPEVERAETLVAQHRGDAFALLEQLLLGWWEAIGSTRLSGISKLMMAEAGNFPAVAAFYHQQVIGRLRGMLARVLEYGMTRGEFRPLEIESCINVIIAPPLLLNIWKHSLACCAAMPQAEETIRTQLALLREGLPTRTYNSAVNPDHSCPGDSPA